MWRLLWWLMLLTLAVTVLVPTAIARGCRGPRLAPAPSSPEHETCLVRLFVTKTGELLELDIQEYLQGVVAAEMPATFHIEALKAQAVASRTYVLRRLRSSGGPGCDRHPLADVCDDPKHHQGWLSGAELRRRWVWWQYIRNRHKIAKAVAATEGMVLVYNAELCDAVYHSTCGGKTEDAADVWGESVPYLRSVACNWDAHSPRYSSTVWVRHEELLRIGGGGGSTIEIVDRSATGRAKLVRIGQSIVSATAFREAFGLNSTWFDIRHQGDRVQFSVRGYGHGVGLCQYGADGMARQGAEWTDILCHYYPGATIESFAGK